MNDDNYYVDELKKCIRGGVSSTSLPVVEAFQDYLIANTDSYLQAYQKNDFEALQKMLECQRKVRNELTIELRGCQYQAIVISSKLVQTYNIFNKIIHTENEKKHFEKNMDMVEQTHKNVKQVLKYLYKHMHVQHKILKQELEIPGSTLTDLLNVLEKVECIERIKSGKCSFYNLTNEGRQYARNKIRGIEDEIIIDPERFRDDSRAIARNKKNYVEIFIYKNCNRKEWGYQNPNFEKTMSEKWRLETMVW